MNVEKMKRFMKERGLTAAEMAQVVGINESTWFRKINRNGDTLTVREMNLIIHAFGIAKSEAAEIFFNEKLA